MGRFTDEEKAAILAEARATIADIELELLARHRPPLETSLEGFQRRANERDAARERHKWRSAISGIERRVEAALVSTLTASFGAMVEAEHKYLVDQLLPELFNTIADSVRDEIKETLIAELRTDVAAIKKRLGIEAVTDIPAIPLRQQRPN